MSDWNRCTLESLGEIVGGATPSTNNENYYGGDIAWITPKDLSTYHGRFIGRGERTISAEGLKSCSARLMPPHSVLFTSRAPIGYVAIAENEVCTNQGFKSIVPNTDTDYLFLYYLLVYNRDRIENMGSGTTFKEVSGSVMKQLEVFIPSDKAEQRAIAETLSALDNKIENNSKINHHLTARSATDSSPDIRRGKRASRRAARQRFSVFPFAICRNISRSVLFKSSPSNGIKMSKSAISDGLIDGYVDTLCSAIACSRSTTGSELSSRYRYSFGTEVFAL